MVCCFSKKFILNVKTINSVRRVTFSNESFYSSNLRESILQRRQLTSSYKRLFYSSPTHNAVLLSPHDVNIILRENEYSKEFSSGSVKAYESNQLASNNPIEDTRCEAQCQLTTGLLLGIFDGHGGASCAQVISKRLFKYIAACLLPAPMLEKYLTNQNREELVITFNDKLEIVEDLKPLYENSFDIFLKELSKKNSKDNFDMKSALETAFLQMDSDISNEVLEVFNHTGKVNKKTLSVAVSGAVACVAHVDGSHLHVANVGDCNAVLGVLSENNDWIPKKLTIEHNADNAKEVQRILKEHPISEKETVIKFDRLLGQLAPLRSLGDLRYKWPNEIMEKIVIPYLGSHVIPPDYHTPPYLSAQPDVFHYQLTPRDKFMVIASDGLWDMMSPHQVVKLVGEHMMGKVFFTPLKLQHKDMLLGDINEVLLHRKEGLKSKPIDKNAATHLIRHALGGTDYGIEHSRISEMLTLPQEISRLFRDDITITVVYFDTEYLRYCPA